MKTQDLHTAAEVFQQLGEMQYVVTLERFATVALAKHKIEREAAQRLFNIFSNARRIFGVINTEYDRKNFTDRLPLAIEIAEETYLMYNRESSLPKIAPKNWYSKDARRYFLNDTSDGNKRIVFDVDMSMKPEIIAFAELLKREEIEVVSVTHMLGKLQRSNNSKIEETNYYDGDIVFVFGDPTDTYWRSYYHSNDEGVYLATDRGFRKLLYTPGRGYIDNKGNVQFEDEENFYNEHIIQGLCDSRDWRIVGNIHDNMNVLVDKEEDEQ